MKDWKDILYDKIKDLPNNDFCNKDMKVYQRKCLVCKDKFTPKNNTQIVCLYQIN